MDSHCLLNNLKSSLKTLFNISILITCFTLLQLPTTMKTSDAPQWYPHHSSSLYLYLLLIPSSPSIYLLLEFHPLLRCKWLSTVQMIFLLGVLPNSRVQCPSKQHFYPLNLHLVLEPIYHYQERLEGNVKTVHHGLSQGWNFRNQIAKSRFVFWWREGNGGFRALKIRWYR